MLQNWIAVDWGTTNFRAWNIDGDGTVRDRVSLPAGLNQISGLFESVLLEAAGAWLDARRTTQVLIAGMAGARQGWVEAPYVEAPADLGRLQDNLCVVPGTDSRIQVAIVPGLCQPVEASPDVMRGEEVQLLGLKTLLPDHCGPVCLPGTHAKWVQLDGHVVTRFTTHMTGEIFALLCDHSILRHSLDIKDSDRHDETDGFAHGINTTRQADGKILPHLFDVRAGDLLLDRVPRWNADFLSGLLIAGEIIAALDEHQDRSKDNDPVAIIAAGGLAKRYKQALEQLDRTACLVDGEAATLAGLCTVQARRLSENKKNQTG